MKKGFTLLEFLIAVGVIFALGAIIASVFHNFRSNVQLNSAAENGVSMLLKARARTLSSVNSSQYGVHFASSSIVLFKGAVYSASDPDNEEVLLPPNDVEISCIALNGGGPDVVFNRLTGDTSQHGSVTFHLIREPEKTRKIAILPSGTSKLLEPEDNLVAYWDFDENTGSTVYDRSINENNGALTNMDPATDWTSGRKCRALEFDGGDDYVLVPAGGDLDITGDITISMWVRPWTDSDNFHSSWNYFIYHKDPNQSGTMKQELGYYDDDGPRFKPYNQTGSDFDFSPDLDFNADTWYHVVHLRRGANLEIYVDGALADSRSDFTGTLRITGANGEIQIGGHGGSSGFMGAIDEVRIYDRALELDEIRRLYEVGL